MTITAAALRAGIREWARSESRALQALQRALEIVNRQRTGVRQVRTIEELAEALLLSLARSHETQTGEFLGRLNEALDRLLDDVAAIRTAAERARRPQLREADLRVLAEAITEMRTFEDFVRRTLDDNAASVDSTLHAALDPPTPSTTAEAVGDAATATAREIPPLTRSRSRGREILDWAAQVVEAWQAGRTLESRGLDPARVPWRDHPTLRAAMDRMSEAVAAFREARHTDPAAAAEAVDALQREVARAAETLRSFARRFESVTTGDRVPPTRPAAGRPTPPPGSAAASALADALAVVTRLARRGLRSAPAADLFRAMEFSPIEVRANGVLGEPLSRRLPGMGQETYALTPSDIRVLPTRPPWLGRRLASLIRGWQRAHLIGPGFGGELFAGLMSAPWGVNQIAQNQGVEALLRAAARVVDRVEVTVRASGRRLAIPLADGSFEYVDVLDNVRYHIPRQPPHPPMTFEIIVQPNGSWQIEHRNFPEGAIAADVPMRGTR
ncbi:MAG TPA: polymorphic toxin type 4 domain-containing protein [Candidatus Limnocylindrales bacterium]